MGSIHAFHYCKEALVLQYNFRYPDVSVKRLGAHRRQKAGDHHVFRDVHNTGCNGLTAVLLLKRDGEV